MGINYAINIDKVISVVLRGDAVRMQSTVVRLWPVHEARTCVPCRMIL